MITLTEKKWNVLKEQLAEEHGPSVMLLRGKCKDVLGFTPRYGDYSNWPDRNVYLDFFDESKETWFILKYQHND